MTARCSLMRPHLSRSRLFRTYNAGHHPATVAFTARPSTKCADPTACHDACRCFAHVSDIDRLDRDVFFTPTPLRSAPPPLGPSGSDHTPPDKRTLQLGKTVRTLHERLPSLLQSPLPGEILSPQITLHLFPSTHPHLPTVAGRIPYIAALWTAPVAWGRVPLIGNVKLTILSERMVRNGGSAIAHGHRDEKLIVKWKTCGRTKHRDGTGGVYKTRGLARRDPVDRIREFIAGSSADEQAVAKKLEGQDEDDFTGIFVFEFDEEGRVVKHVIEHTEEGGDCDRMTRVVSVTDWLLGRFNGKGQTRLPELALCEERPSGTRIRMMDRRG